jgi:aspartate beta-hydroxylase
MESSENANKPNNEPKRKPPSEETKRKSISSANQNQRKKKSPRSLIIYFFPVCCAIILWYFLNQNLFDRYKVFKEEKRTTKNIIKPNEKIETESSTFVIKSKLDDSLNEQNALKNYKNILGIDELAFKKQFMTIESLIDEQKFQEATKILTPLAHTLKTSARVLYLSAVIIDRQSEIEKSQFKFKKAIQIYKKLIALDESAIDSNLLFLSGMRLINRLQLSGKFTEAIQINKYLISKMPQNVDLINQLGINYLIVHKPKLAKLQFAYVLESFNHSVSQCHYALILKQYENKLDESIEHFISCLSNQDDMRVRDARFYYHLGDALQRKNRKKEAFEFYEIGVRHKLFLSVYQRSLYNELEAESKPLWVKKETNYTEFFTTLEENWSVIREEALKELNHKRSFFISDEETLLEKGEWKQLHLFQNGKKVEKNCARTPFTCKLVENIELCRRGQVKFSVMSSDIHVWPHCAPTNCRLRAHLTLQSSTQNKIVLRVLNETREWVEGKVFLFDDSFEHEIYETETNQNNATFQILVLIVDVWHPGLSESKRQEITSF